jgi:uncharacterized protein YecT (DUF1311 family)
LNESFFSAPQLKRDSLDSNLNPSQRMFFRVNVGLALIALPLTSLAAQDSTSRACWDSALTQASMNGCAGSDLQKSRDRLQSLLRELRGALDSTGRRGLDSVQHRWQAYAQAQCRWEGAAYDGGSMRPMIEASCLSRRTEERIDVLKPFLCGHENQTSDCEAAKRYDRSGSQ